MPGEHVESLVKKSFRQRLKADTSVGVSDLMHPFKVYIEKGGCRDILKLLQCPVDMDWKSIPQHRWLVKNKVLFSLLLEVAPNTVITSRKVKEALSRIHEEKSINFSKKENGDLWDWVDTKVRIGCAQLRELKSSTIVWDRCMKRCTDEEKDVLKEMMDQIELGKCGGSDSQDIVDSQQQESQEETRKTGAATSPTECTALVCTEGHSLRTPDAPTTRGVTTKTRHGNESFSPSSSAQGTMMSPQDVFSSILSKQRRPKNRRMRGKTTSSSMEATPEKNAASSSSVRKALRFDDLNSQASEQEELDDARASRSSKGSGSLIILPAGQKIINSRKSETAQTIKETSSKKRQLEDDSVNSSQEDVFLSSLLNAAIQDEDDDEDEKGKTTEKKKGRKKEETPKMTEKKTTSKEKTNKEQVKKADLVEKNETKAPPKDAHALTKVGLFRVDRFAKFFESLHVFENFKLLRNGGEIVRGRLC